MGAGRGLRAFFLGVREDVAQAVEDAGGKAAEFGGETARRVRASVDAIDGAEAANAEAVSALRRDGGTGMQGRIARMLNPEGSSTEAGARAAPRSPKGFDDILNGGKAPAGRLPSWLRPRRAGSAIDGTLKGVNPNYDPADPAYSRNCTEVVQAYELRRRGFDVQAGPLARHWWSSEGGHGPGLRPITDAWGGKFEYSTKPEIEQAFSEEGSRGIVAIMWQEGGFHVSTWKTKPGRFVSSMRRIIHPMYLTISIGPTPVGTCAWITGLCRPRGRTAHGPESLREDGRGNHERDIRAGTGDRAQALRAQLDGGHVLPG
jgi:hypothetical protein